MAPRRDPVDRSGDRGTGSVLGILTAAPGRADRLRHVADLPAREGRAADWPTWVHHDLRAALERSGVSAPWQHQVAAAEAARLGQHTVVATGTASGKTLAFWLPVLTTVLDGTQAPTGRGATAVYLSPTKALSQDQARSLAALDLPALRAATYDGDTPREERSWVRAHATYVLTNPDMLHHAILPGHSAWASFLRALRYVVVDECHAYRGVFGSHVAAVLRRLRRVAQRYGSDPVVLCASATVAEPARVATRLIGAPVVAVAEDASPRGRTTVALWQPPLTDLAGEAGAPVRRSTVAETADLMADLVLDDVQTLAFVRSRRAAEAVAALARDHVAEVDPDLAGRVAAYRGGFLPEERRALETGLRDRWLMGLAATNALELGIDIAGLDAVLIAGWPGTRASFWQQVGRAGRRGTPATALFIARDDPLDTYLIDHPDAVFGAPVETTVLDPDNPYVLAGHLCAAAAEFPLTEDDLATWFGSTAVELAVVLADRGLLRRRPAGWFWTRRERASDLADLRGTGGGPVRVVEDGTGRLLGTVDPAAAHTTVHPGAVYVHQGATHLVTALDLADAVAVVVPATVDYTTSAREVSDITIVATAQQEPWGEATLSFGTVEVTSQVVAFLRRRLVTGEVLGEEPLDLPPRHLRTRAVWWTVSPELLALAGLPDADVPGSAHAAEHAAIGMLPLVATCDRWDIGGVSTALHPDTGRCTVFVYDGHPGGAGFAERGFHAARVWLAATRAAIAGCPCHDGCPACVQSPKCGNGNHPLDKSGAIRLLDVLLAGAGASTSEPD